MTENVYIAANGKEITREYLEDPDRPGHVMPGRWPLSAMEFLAAGFFDLKNNRGFDLRLRETSPNPLGRKALEGEMPEGLRKSREQAAVLLAEEEALCDDKRAIFHKAVKSLDQCLQRIGIVMRRTPGETREVYQLSAEVDAARKEFSRAQDKATEARSLFCSWDKKYGVWLTNEAMRRNAEEAEAALKARLAEKHIEPTPTLAERLSQRLSSLVERVAG